MLRKKALPACIFACFIGMSLIAQAAKELKVEDLSVDSSSEAVAQAHADLKKGIAIVRVTSGSQKDIERLIGVPLLAATVQVVTGHAPATSAQLLNSPPLQMTAVAAYKDEQGVIRSAVVYSSATSTAATSQDSSLNSLNTWIEQEQARALSSAGEGDNPEPPAEAWTAVYRQTAIVHRDGGGAELTVGLFRLNTISKNSDYYMVATVPQTMPDFDGTCNGAHCGWHTVARSVFMGPVVATPEGDGTLTDHGPTGTITDKETGFDVGGDLSKEGPGFSAGYSEHWSTPSVVTTDHSERSQGHWDENMQFSGNECNPTSAPVTSTGTFLSRQAGIFEVPAGTTQMTVPMTFNSRLCWYDAGESPNFQPTYLDLGMGLSPRIGPPLLAASPSNITLPAGGTGAIAIESDIPNSDEGFSWTAESNDTLVATIPSRGPFSTGRLLPITIKPDAKDGETATISINSDPPYAAPSVRTGPLEVTVTVGTPKKQAIAGVLLAGGTGGVEEGGINATSQVYDYASNTVVDAQPPKVPRFLDTATRLKDGRVLIVGGATERGGPFGPPPVTATAEIFDPSSLAWTTTGSLNTARRDHTATRLPDGKVLITGGFTGDGSRLASAELYDPVTGKFTPTGNMLTKRASHYAVLLPNSGASAKVLVYGGITPGGVEQNGAEIWDESTGAFTAASAAAPRFFSSPYTPKPAPLESGELDIIGGITESNDPSGDETLLMLGNPPSFSSSAKKLNHPRLDHTLTALPNDQGLLVTGGAADTHFSTVLQDAEIRDASGWNLLDAKMISPRYLHTATLLPDGKVFIAGGFGAAEGALGSTEFYDPATRSFTAGPSMVARAQHTATLFSTTLTALAVSPLNPISGESVALSAQVTSASGTPSGTVRFLDGSSVIATATLSDGQANTSYNKFAVGSHTLIAVYSGDDINGESTSDPVTVDVALSGSSVSLSSTPNPSEVGQDVIFVATVQLQSGTGDTATGTLTFKDGDTVLATEPLKNNQASYTDHSLGIGPHAITAIYSGDATHGGGTSAVINQQVNQRATNITLTATPPNPVFGDTVTLTSTVTYAAKALRHSGDLTGTVTYKDGNKVLGEASLKYDTASLQVDSLHGGSHHITATYSGDSNSSGSTSPVLTLTVAQASSKTNLESSKNPSTVGEAVTFTAHVTSTAGTPSGTVLFSDGDKPIGSAHKVVNGAANLSTSALSAGEHSITVAYSGDDDFSSSSSTAVRQQVNSATVSTTTTLSSSPNPSTKGQPVTFQVQVTPASGTGVPTGIVNFWEGSSTLGSASLAAGFASLTVSDLTDGTHVITAVYGGDTNFGGSTSSPLSQVVQPASTKFPARAVIVGAPNPSNVGESVAFTVTVSSDGGGTPTGSITVSEPVPNNNIIYGSTNLINGVGTVTTSALIAGTHQIYATYGGDSTHTSDTSAPFTQTVNGSGGPGPLPSIAINASIGSRSGTQVALLLTITNTGTVKAESIDLSQIAFRTLAGTGEVTIASPSVPIQVGSLLPHAATTVPLTLNVPTAVKKLAITENGTLESSGNTPHQFSLGQVVFP